jgi:hypothetical protein
MRINVAVGFPMAAHDRNATARSDCHAGALGALVVIWFVGLRHGFLSRA